jgi:hypothetical protein
MWPAGVFWILSGGTDLTVSSGQHSSSYPINIAPATFGVQDDRSAWLAQIARQFNDRTNTPSASVNAINLFTISKRYFIRADYNEYRSDRQYIPIIMIVSIEANDRQPTKHSIAALSNSAIVSDSHVSIFARLNRH